MKKTKEPLEDFPQAVWECIRRDHEELEAFQASPLHLKAKSRLREILSRPLSKSIRSVDEEKKIPER
ncbi:MAG: hypothetical protein NTZ08_14155 [Verrucomicrobia bacterium]|nr:hypothetical protein [Verrucomicrobiota bacterium]